MKCQSVIGVLLVVVIVSVLFAGAVYFKVSSQQELPKFSSCQQMAAAFAASSQNVQRGYSDMVGGIAPMAAQTTGLGTAKSESGADYSTTNIQVAGVDEADIVKSDGTYIYTISSSNAGYYSQGSMLTIAKAYPAGEAEIASQTGFTNFTASEMFIEGSRLLVFGNSYVEGPMPLYESGGGVADGAVRSMMMPYYYPYRLSSTELQLWDISDRASPRLVRTVDFEGSYITSRKIGTDVYFAINSYPRYYPMASGSAGAEGGSAGAGNASYMIPMYKDSASGGGFAPSCGCADIAYLPPMQAESFITIASVSMSSDNAEVRKEVVVGSGQDVFASQQNLYVAQSVWGYGSYGIIPMGIAEDVSSQANTQKTVVHRFALSNGGIAYAGSGEVPGRILNQFSMDEYNSYFRIATNIDATGEGQKSSSAVYVLDYNNNMTIAGRLEGIAPGESMYAARFMGSRAYLVTFKQIDPFFVIDLSNPANPQILGKLKIPGYSSYLQPYDENHVIGVGKDVNESIDADKVHSEDAVYYTAVGGVKLSLFDVTDVSNPVEISKYVIGDRGTESDALTDHKALLFDREKGLLVLPVTVAEMPAGASDEWSYGDFVFQGAYVFDLTLTNGFMLKGRITHYDSDEAFRKSGYYFGGYGFNVRRSLYIGNVLYTISNNKIKANSLADLSELKALVVANSTESTYPILY